MLEMSSLYKIKIQCKIWIRTLIIKLKIENLPSAVARMKSTDIHQTLREISIPTL